jgi:hypothetical protein
MTTTAGHSFYIGPIGSFYNQVNDTGSWVEDLPMIISGQFGFNCPSGFREEAFWSIFPIVSNVKLNPAVAAILNFISEQKTQNL